MAESLVLRTRVDHVTTLTLNRPARRNALNPPLVEALIEALQAVGDEPETRVVVLRGAGDAFCAGGNLAGAPTGGLLAMHEARGRFADLLRALLGCRRPTIAAVAGPCLGGGLGLMLACDLAVAERGATFGTPEVKVGLFPMMIMALIFRTMGRRRALEMMLTAERLDVEAAREAGLLNRIAEAGELDAAIASLADRVASFSPAVLELGRQAVVETMDMGLDEALAHLHGKLTLNTLLEDAAVGIQAFLTKQPPQWRGR